MNGGLTTDTMGEVSQFMQVLTAATGDRFSLNASGELLIKFRNVAISPLKQYMKFKVIAAPVRSLPFFAFDLP